MWRSVSRSSPDRRTSTTPGGPRRHRHAGLRRCSALDRSELRGRGAPQHDPRDRTGPRPRRAGSPDGRHPSGHADPLDGDQPVQVFTVSYEINGQQGRYPPGILIGEVASVIQSTNALETAVTVRPAVDFSALEYVLVYKTDQGREARRGDPQGPRDRRGGGDGAALAIHRLRTAPSAGRSARAALSRDDRYRSARGPERGCDRRIRERPRTRLPDERTEGTDRAHAHAARLLGGDVPAVHRVAVAAVPTIVVAVGTAAGLAFYEVVSVLLGYFHEQAAYGVRVALLAALYNAVLTPILYPLLRRITEGSRPRRVVRF